MSRGGGEDGGERSLCSLRVWRGAGALVLCLSCCLRGERLCLCECRVMDGEREDSPQGLVGLALRGAFQSMVFLSLPPLFLDWREREWGSGERLVVRSSRDEASRGDRLRGRGLSGEAGRWGDWEPSERGMDLSCCDDASEVSGRRSGCLLKMAPRTSGMSSMYEPFLGLRWMGVVSSNCLKTSRMYLSFGSSALSMGVRGGTSFTKAMSASRMSANLARLK